MRFTLLVFALLAAGCSSGPLVTDAPEAETPTGYPDHSVADILAAVEASVASVGSVAADGDLDIEGNGGSQSATFSLRARLADSLTVVVRGPLGIEGGRGLVTPDSFYAADRINRQFLLGPVEAADRYVPGAGSSERMARAVLGLLVPEADVDWSLSAVDGAYRLVGRLGAGAREYTIDPGLWRVVRVREFDAEGRSTGTQTAEAFDTIDGVVLPRRVRLDGGGTSVELEHRRLVVNPPDLRLRFARPEGYEVVRIY
ncbi:MAG: DUF4292 domain-containing protein [Bacteroidota bacterium]